MVTYSCLDVSESYWRKVYVTRSITPHTHPGPPPPREGGKQVARGKVSSLNNSARLMAAFCRIPYLYLISILCAHCCL